MYHMYGGVGMKIPYVRELNFLMISLVGDDKYE